MNTSLRVVIINPTARSITEGKLNIEPTPNMSNWNAVATKALKKLMGVGPETALETPISNGGTGDTIYINPEAKPEYTFLGYYYGGIAVIAGKSLAIDAVVPLKRVKTQVIWSTPQRVTPASSISRLA